MCIKLILYNYRGCPDSHLTIQLSSSLLDTHTTTNIHTHIHNAHKHTTHTYVQHTHTLCLKTDILLESEIISFHLDSTTFLETHTLLEA